LSGKGRIEAGADADVVVLRTQTLEPVHLVSSGPVLMRDGVMLQQDRFLQKSVRRIHLEGHET
jgi:hypothetical protein